MRSSKQVLDYKQQKIKEILQQEKLNGNDLTKKELIDKIRNVLEQDYQYNERLKEKRLREEEIRRIRKLRMDGKITAEEEEYLIHNANKKEYLKLKLASENEKSDENKGFNSEFQLNPTFRTKTKYLTLAATEDNDQTTKEHVKDNKKESTPKHDTTQRKTTESATTEVSKNDTETTETEEVQTEQKEEHDMDNKNKEDSEKGKETERRDSQKIDSNETKTNCDEDKENEDEILFRRELSEMSRTLYDENDLVKLYELAEKMVFISSKK